MSRASIGSTCCSSYIIRLCHGPHPGQWSRGNFPNSSEAIAKIRTRGLSVKSQEDHCSPCAVVLKLIQYPSHHCKVSSRIRNPANFGETTLVLCDWSVDHSKPDLFHFAVLRNFRRVLDSLRSCMLHIWIRDEGEGRKFPCNHSGPCLICL